MQSTRKRVKVLDDEDICKLNISSALCGALVVNGPVFNPPYDLQTVSPLQLGRENENETGLVHPALLNDLPQSPAMVVHLYLEGPRETANTLHTFINLGANEETYFARPEYSLHNLVPPKTLVLAFAYLHDAKPMLSIFDCSVLQGVDLRKDGPTERFRKLLSCFKARNPIGHHWIGNMNVAAEQYLAQNAPFCAHCVCRVPDILHE